MKNISEENKELILTVAKGNPGALHVIMQLMWFTEWQKMMRWCKEHLSGSDLWVKYKDEFNQDSHRLGRFIQDQLTPAPSG